MSTTIDNKLYIKVSSGTTSHQIERIGIAYIKSLISRHYDKNLVIYKTMKKLQGDELRAWFIEHFIPYIVDDKDYNYDGFFLKNIPFREWLKEMNITRGDIYCIFNCTTLLEILRTLDINIKVDTTISLVEGGDDINEDWPIEILIKYWKYHIEEEIFHLSCEKEEIKEHEEYFSEKSKDYIICALHAKCILYPPFFRL